PPDVVVAPGQGAAWLCVGLRRCNPEWRGDADPDRRDPGGCTNHGRRCGDVARAMNLLFVKLRTAIALGLRNLLRVAWFRLGVRYGWNPVRRLRAALPGPPFYSMAGAARRELIPSTAWGDSASYFGRWPVPVSQ